MKPMARIYVASSWRNNIQDETVNTLRKLGHEVYDFKNPPKKSGFAWSEIDPDWENWTTDQYVRALEHPRAVEGFKSDFDAMKWADICVMVLPCGRSANTEAGWMKGAGKKVFVFQPTGQEPELMYKIYDKIITSMDELVEVFSINHELNELCDLYEGSKDIIHGYLGFNASQAAADLLENLQKMRDMAATYITR